MTEKKRAKRQKPEDFIGWKSEDGKLEVVGVFEHTKGKPAKFKVTCTECSKDKELFPDGYFVTTKGDIIKGNKPCGCSKIPKWKPFQFLILAYRAGEKKDFIVHGFKEFKGAYTKLDLECLKDGHKWTAIIHSVINKGSGCPKCRDILLSNQRKIPEETALQKCVDICKEMDYNPIGFVDGYKNNKSARFEYICKIHGKQNVRHHDFVNTGSRCKGCAKYGYSTSKQGTFYVYQWTKDGHSFIKFGITNQKEVARIKKQKRETEYKYKRVWSANFEDGSIPLHIENYIKNARIEIGIMPKEEFPDGFTETTYTDNLIVLENLITDALCILTRGKV